MKKRLIRYACIAVLLLVTVGIYVYTWYFVPNHGEGNGVEYADRLLVIYTPCLFFLAGCAVAPFLRDGERKKYLLLFACSFFVLATILRCIFYPISTPEIPMLLFAETVYTAIMALIHAFPIGILYGLRVILSR